VCVCVCVDSVCRHVHVWVCAHGSHMASQSWNNKQVQARELVPL
jgi:hypothetical protein